MWQPAIHNYHKIHLDKLDLFRLMISVHCSFVLVGLRKVALWREAALFMRSERGEVGKGEDQLNPSVIAQ